MRLELILEEEIGDFGCLTYEGLDHRVLSTHSKVFGNCEQLFVEFSEDGESGSF